MSQKINDGGPAFPIKDWGAMDYDGMTLRDYFAATALQGAMINGGCHGHIDGEGDADTLGKLSYKYADAMLAARKAK